MQLPFCLFLQTNKLITLGGWDISLIAIYFVAVLAIGFYLKGQTETGEDFFFGRSRVARMDRRFEFPVGKPGFAGTDGLGRGGLPVWNSWRALVLDRHHTRDSVSQAGDD